MDNISIVSVSGAARRIEDSESNIRYLADTGKLPCLRDADSGRRMFFLADLERFRKQREAKRKAKNGKPVLRLKHKRT